MQVAHGRTCPPNGEAARASDRHGEVAHRRTRGRDTCVAQVPADGRPGALPGAGIAQHRDSLQRFRGLRWNGSLVALAAITLVLASCAAVPSGPAPSAARAAALARQGNPGGAGQMYEALARASEGARRNSFALQAAHAYLIARRPDDAAHALDLLVGPLMAPERFDRSLIEVRIALQRGRAAQAWSMIQAFAAPRQAQPASRYWRLREQAAFAAGHAAAGVEAQMRLEHWLLDAAAVESSRKTLLDELRDAAERGVMIHPGIQRDPIVRGWLELAPLAAQAARNPTAAAAALSGWLASHPGHPAVEVVRSQLLGEQPQPLAAQAHIALLLPITGPAGALAASVRDGFLTAYYQAPVRERPLVRVYDTSNGQPIADVIAKATRAGADIIVGPLMRPAVAAAAADRMQRPPLLALNFLPQGEQAPPLFFQFALSPVAEAKLAARRVLSDGHPLGIAIVPAGQWGARVLAAFTQQLQSGGGTLLASTMIDPSAADYSAQLKQVLGIDQSRARLERLQALLGTRLAFVPRRRQDIQFIFAPAPAGIERLLQPQLRFFYAGGVATYATSDAFEPDPRANEDLSGLMFPAAPWMLGSPLAEAVHSAARQAWQAEGPASERLFDFGFDAYRLASALRQNSAASSLDINGLTGQLTLGADGRIERHLVWARFRDGELVPLASAPGS
jgi:outer membrane PBP1 activator LpoA protein